MARRRKPGRKKGSVEKGKRYFEYDGGLAPPPKKKRKKLNANHIVWELAWKLGITRRQARDVLNATIDAFAYALGRDGKLVIRGLGRFLKNTTPVIQNPEGTVYIRKGTHITFSVCRKIRDKLIALGQEEERNGTEKTGSPET